jgi:AbrB family looped-hinge helix DNA binding protein
MRTTIDKAGRIVVPKAMREELGLAGGQEVEITAADGEIVISPVSVPKRLVIAEDGRPVIVADGPMPPLTDEIVRATLEAIRR